MEILAQIADGIVKGSSGIVKDKVLQALDCGVAPLVILREGLVAGLAVVGDNFKKREMFVPNLLLSARAMTMAIKLLEPLLAKGEVPVIGKVVLGTVEGDLHDIGKNLVGFMLKNSGFEVIDIGIDVRKEKFVQAVAEHNPDILAMAALLTSTMPEFTEVIRALVKAGLRSNVKIMVGGAPVSRWFADRVGADAYATDAADAVEVARSLVARTGSV
ncbi:MAG: cobalamin-dependent protein [Negativicutes bacterium]|nr:cobalamin-dependent protein [Negativicutes bacterium]